MIDSFGREINYMRISVTDRCNLRCRYCMPFGIKKIPMDHILSYEQILETVEACVSLGIDRFKITGGEPLVRKGITDLIRTIKHTRGVKSVTLTTNGVLLEDALDELSDAGIDGVNISLDTLDRNKYAAITGFDLIDKVLKGIDASVNSGFNTKVNSVLQQGVNDEEWHSLLLLAKDRPLDVRFIELMPIGDADSSESVSNNELRERIFKQYPGAHSDRKIHGNGPAEYIHIPGFAGSIGFISAMHGKFCSSCNRIRLTSTGMIKTCLCYSDSTDITPAFNEGVREKRIEALKAIIKRAVAGKQQEHHFERSEFITESKKMVEIGG